MEKRNSPEEYCVGESEENVRSFHESYAGALFTGA
jgi:hypothetical protein